MIVIGPFLDWLSVALSMGAPGELPPILSLLFHVMVPVTVVGMAAVGVVLLGER